MAENHPVGFQWVVEAREKGATIIHVDPRYTRTSAMADIWVPLRAGSDIVFLGALVHYVLENNKQFHDYVLHYTNASTILREDFRDTEDLDGFFSGWDAEKKKYDPESWLYQGSPDKDELPLHFGASGLGAAVGILELLGHRKSHALQALGLGAALFETWEGLRLESRRSAALNPLKQGSSGLVTRTGGVLSGPIPLLLRTLSLFSSTKRSSSLRRWAAASAVAGSLSTRIAWIHAGHASAQNWKLPLEIDSNRVSTISPLVSTGFTVYP